MSTLGKRLIKAAKEARTIARGEARPKTFRVHTPSDIDVPAIRKRLGLSQNEFSARFGIRPAHCAIGSRTAAGRKARRAPYCRSPPTTPKPWRLR